MGNWWKTAAALVGVHALLIAGCGKAEELSAQGPRQDATSQTAQTSALKATLQLAERYDDPRGYFTIVPPAGWRSQEYPSDPRGKVAFIAPGDRGELRVLAKAVDIPDYDGLVKSLKDIEEQLGVQTNIEPVVFNGMPAIKRVIMFTVRGVTRRLLSIDLLIDGVSHNLQYGAPPSAFDEHYEIAWQSMLTYEPLKRQEPPSPEEARKHEAAKWIRLARIALEMGMTQAAKDAVSAGLEADPENAELEQLRSDLAKR